MIYAIGDIHGQKTMLDHALHLIETDGGPDAKIVFVGDYTDRGLDSRAVIETLIEGQRTGRNWTFLKGNHDRFFSYFVQYGRQHDPRVKSGINWLNPRLGGTNTLASYGVISDETPIFEQQDGAQEQLVNWQIDGVEINTNDLAKRARDAVPQTHLNFLDNCPMTYETDDLLFVHAGLRPGVALADQDDEDLLWIREGFLESDYDFGKLVVHGHTALDAPTHFGNRVDIDGGAGYGRPLVPVAFEKRDCWTLTKDGRKPLIP